MNQARFEELCKELERDSESLLEGKRQDYSPQEDVLQNFKLNGQFLGLTPEQICIVYISKHLQALVNSSQGHTLVVEGARSRILDIYNYLKLLNALVTERTPAVPALGIYTQFMGSQVLTRLDPKGGGGLK